jgi:hypothetical protein
MVANHVHVASTLNKTLTLYLAKSTVRQNALITSRFIRQVALAQARIKPLIARSNIDRIIQIVKIRTAEPTKHLAEAQLVVQILAT